MNWLGRILIILWIAAGTGAAVCGILLVVRAVRKEKTTGVVICLAACLALFITGLCLIASKKWIVQW